VLRFTSLGSGSSGNATVVEATSGITTTRLLVDAGLGLKELGTRLARAGLTCEDIDAVFVTHEHGDHVGCAVAFATQRGIPIWMSRGTWRAIDSTELPRGLRFARDGETIAVGDVEVLPFTVPHDAAEPLQLVATDGGVRLGIVTDLGASTPHLLAHLRGLHALLLECNHDPGLLAVSRYPSFLKARVGGRFGHLSNVRAAELLDACRTPALTRVVAAHLSRENNSPSLVREALAAVWSTDTEDLVIADAENGFGWLGVG
jgi:phosphoribosyl 1,2-cyclic phosphodiesterase